MVLLIMFLIFPAAAKEVDDDDIDHDAIGQCPKALFAFGASASDTGTVRLHSLLLILLKRLCLMAKHSSTILLTVIQMVV
jgi:hypothetical protein